MRWPKTCGKLNTRPGLAKAMGEFEIIDKYFKGAMMPNHVSVGPGDDCAVLTVPPGFELCVSTDTLIEGVHFPLNADPGLVSRRAIGANLSDLAAMGAKPHAMTLALTIPDTAPHWLEGFSAENNRLCELYDIPIIGGNLARGSLSVTLNVMGLVPAGAGLLRSTAKQGDGIYVSGALGAAAGAVAQLNSEAPDGSLFLSYSSPTPRLQLGQGLLGIANAAIDISDGLLADLCHILVASGVGAEITLSQIPVAKSLHLSYSAEQALNFALNGGDDYELCFTASPDNAAAIESLGEACGVSVSKIGVISGERGILKSSSGDVLNSAGYEHFTEGDDVV